MKISFRFIITAVVATGLGALPAPALADAPATNAAPAVVKPAKPAAPKAAAKPVVKKAEPKPEPVFNPEPGVARQANVNIRGQAKINSEIVGHLKKGEALTILEEITIATPKQDEPARWFRILLPSGTNTSVWIHSSFVDAATATVKGSKLNLRGGPGEEYSIIGRLDKGVVIKQLETKGDWLKIEAPTNAFGFVAAHLVAKTPVEIAVKPVTPKPEEPVTPPTTVSVATNPTPVIAENPTTTPVVPPVTTPAVPVITPPVDPLPEAPVEKVKKIVSREGFLKGSASIQAPTYFELRSLDTGRTIDYVFSPSTNLLLWQFKGQRVIVTGEELLDERWQNTPVLILDSLQTVP